MVDESLTVTAAEANKHLTSLTIAGRRTTMTNELKPCPFCDSQVRVDHGNSNMPFLFFRCFSCGAVVSFATEECDSEPIKAIDLWNTRKGSNHDWTKEVP